MIVTPLYAGLLALWFVVLSVRVVNVRRRGILFGDNGDVKITRLVSKHRVNKIPGLLSANLNRLYCR